MVNTVISEKRIKEILDETDPLPFPLHNIHGNERNYLPFRLFGYTKEELEKARIYHRNYYYKKKREEQVLKTDKQTK